VAPEGLVGALSSEYDRCPGRAREAADEAERDAHRVGERLVLVVDEVGEEAERVLVRDLDLVVLRAEVLRYAPGIGALVLAAGPLEADGEGAQPPAGLCRQAHDRARVEAAAQEGAYRDVRHEAGRDA